MIALDAETLRTKLLPRAEWHPYPTRDDRDAWEALPQAVRTARIAQGECALGGEWPLLLAVRYLDFSRNGDRSRYQAPYHVRRTMLANLVIAECMEGQGRFLDEIVNGIWLICEESSWCVPAHATRQRVGVGLPDTTDPIVDLFAAETSALLAWTHYLLGAALDTVSPLVRPRVQREIKARILTPCLERDYGWMGFTGRRVNNWNPWINSNWLTSALLIEEDSERRLEGVSKSLRSLDNFLEPYPRDGGCDEGPGYWGRAGASLFDCLELLRGATDGRIDLYGEPLIQEIGRFIYRVQIDGAYFSNFADASALVMPPPYVVFGYGQRIGDQRMMSLGAWLAAQHDLLQRQGPEVRENQRVSIGRLLPTLFHLEEIDAADPTPPLPRDVWLDQIQVMVARDEEGSGAGLFVAAKGGHNAESHNHNDVGQAIVYVDGKPVIVDAGVETYTRRTFSDQRYEIWTMQSAYHSLPTIGGVMQAPGRTFAARDVEYAADENLARLALDIAGAYPPEAGLRSWRRTVTLRRGQAVEIRDAYDLHEPVGEITLSLMTPCEVDLGTPGEVLLSEAPILDERRSGAGRITYDADRLSVSAEEVAISDERMGAVWGSHLTRLVFRAENPPRQDTWVLTVRPSA
ncbi:MAG: heparinase II/III family protein [Anaerolineae bacterium]|nr:heparinase II/III family protein [Anaerolineae bacterium]